MNNNLKFLNQNLIAYIGNKRRLVPLIRQAIKKTNALNKKNPAFLDLFAGSGVVSRLAKILGFSVYTNDWEYYSYILNKAFLELDDKFLKTAYKKLGGIDNVLNILNNLNEPGKKDTYISAYYCPQNDNNPDIDNERLFYTSYNGKIIDAIRAKIDEWSKSKMINKDEEFLLIALLIYESSTRSNTSGVFKGFHKGFGGTNGDALSRILKPINLEKPSLIEGNAKVFRDDALQLTEKLKDKKFDIVYLDPPYNQHQYGSNYHLLNTIALNDRPAVNKEIFIAGKKTNKSAIRKDWVKTKSTFCYKNTAKEDFKKIIDNLNAHHILISYSTDGIIGFDDMLDILSKKGKLDIQLSEYVKYRGGKQALTTKVRNIEFILMINTKEKSTESDLMRIKKIILFNKINVLMKKSINIPKAFEINFYLSEKENHLIKNYKNKKIIIAYLHNKITYSNISEYKHDDFTFEELSEIYCDLEYITDLTKEDEVYLLIKEILECYKNNHYKKAFNLFKEIPYFISKFNNKKAYIPSLKSIIAVLRMMIETIDVWKFSNLVKYSFFKKLQKIITIKLNYNVFKQYIDYSIAADEYKKEINLLFEYFISALNNETEMINQNVYNLNGFKNYSSIHN